MTTTIGAVTIAALVTWIAGGLALRIAGVALVLTGLGLLIAARPIGLAVAAFGGVAWLAGQLLYGIRHHEYRSPLARRLVQQTPLRRLDTTKNWALRTTTDYGPTRRRRTTGVRRRCGVPSRQPHALHAPLTHHHRAPPRPPARRHR